MPRSSIDNKKIKEGRCDDILSASLKLFALNGYDAVSVDDITKRAGCSHGLFYHYYKDKSVVFAELLKKAKEKDKLLLNTKLEEFHGLEAIQKIIEIWKIALESDGDEPYYLHMFLNAHLQKTIPDDNKRKKHNVFDYLVENIKEGQEDKEIAGGNPRDYARCLLAMFNGFSYTRLFKKPGEYITPDIDIIMNIFKKKVVFNV